jgi:adenylate kinase family enzyme
MLKSPSQRTIIIGNSGTGKSTLAGSIAKLVHVPVVDLDQLHWEAGDYGRKRDEAMARQMALEASARPNWIIEGVFGWLAEAVLPRATSLIWLDFPWSLCRDGLLARGPRRGADEQDTKDLLNWAEAYWSRQTSSSFAGHSQMFHQFSGTKFRLEDRDQVLKLVADLTSEGIALRND